MLNALPPQINTESSLWHSMPENLSIQPDDYVSLFSKYTALSICEQVKGAMHESTALFLRNSVTKSLSWLFHGTDT